MEIGQYRQEHAKRTQGSLCLKRCMTKGAMPPAGQSYLRDEDYLELVGWDGNEQRVRLHRADTAVSGIEVDMAIVV